MDRWKEKLCLEHTWYLYLAATLALEQNKEQQKDIYSLQKSSADYQFRIMELEWDVYDKR